MYLWAESIECEKNNIGNDSTDPISIQEFHSRWRCKCKSLSLNIVLKIVELCWKTSMRYIRYIFSSSLIGLLEQVYELHFRGEIFLKLVSFWNSFAMFKVFSKNTDWRRKKIYLTSSSIKHATCVGGHRPLHFNPPSTTPHPSG